MNNYNIYTAEKLMHEAREQLEREAASLWMDSGLTYNLSLRRKLYSYVERFLFNARAVNSVKYQPCCSSCC
ncbi:HEPN domain-containing protein [Paenibacillus tarimensis]